jgi:hypothetical protein
MTKMRFTRVWDISAPSSLNKPPSANELPTISGEVLNENHLQYSICMASRTSMLSGCWANEAGR